VHLRVDPSDLGKELGQSMGSALARRGLSVVLDERQPVDIELQVTYDLRSIGIAVQGVTTLAVERDGILVDRFATALDVFRRDTYPAKVSGELADKFVASARVKALVAGQRGQGFSNTAAASVPSSLPLAAEGPVVASLEAVGTGPSQAEQSAPPIPAVAPGTVGAFAPRVSADPPALGKSGRFGLGLHIELDFGWAEIFAPQSSLAGAVASLAFQFDLGPRWAFRLPASFVLAGSGTASFGEFALSPSLLYRFRSTTEQPWVPYVGLGLRLGSALGGRRLLNRPVTATASPDGCPSGHYRGRTTYDSNEDCSLFVSPEPQVGIEWHPNRLVSLDAALSYSFAHFSSSESLSRWTHLLQLYLGPRLSF